MDYETGIGLRVLAGFVYFLICVLVAKFGGKKEIGGDFSFWISLILSPLVGSIAVMLSSPKKDDLPIVADTINSIGFKESNVDQVDDFAKDKPEITVRRDPKYLDELKKLGELKSANIITEEEFNQLKSEILNNK